MVRRVDKKKIFIYFCSHPKKQIEATNNKVLFTVAPRGVETEPLDCESHERDLLIVL